MRELLVDELCDESDQPVARDLVVAAVGAIELVDDAL